MFLCATIAGDAGETLIGGGAETGLGFYGPKYSAAIGVLWQRETDAECLDGQPRFRSNDVIRSHTL